MAAADHDHGHDHDHDHHHSGAGHSHAPENFGRAFAIGIALNLGYVVAETLYGIASHSLALIADAGHNMSDVLGLAAAWGAAILARRRPTARYTYGFRSTSILAALGNAIVLLTVTGGIAWEAVRRLLEPEPAAGMTIIMVAAVGIAVNAGTAFLFMAGRTGDLNIKGAFLHMAADALVTLGVVVAGVAMIVTGWLWLDPAVSLVISIVIVVGTWSLLRDAVNLALDAVPDGIDQSAVVAYLEGLEGVTEVHDLHIWAISTTETALTAHLVRPTGSTDDALMMRVCHELSERFRIGHATLQLENGDREHPCRLAPAEVV